MKYKLYRVFIKSLHLEDLSKYSALRVTCVNNYNNFLNIP